MPPLPEGREIRYQSCNAVNSVTLTLAGTSELSVSAKIGKQELEGPSLLIRLLVRDKQGNVTEAPPAPTNKASEPVQREMGF